MQCQLLATFVENNGNSSVCAFENLNAHAVLFSNTLKSQKVTRKLVKVTETGRALILCECKNNFDKITAKSRVIDRGGTS